MVLTFRGQSRFFQESFVAGIQKSGIIDEVNQRRGSCAPYLINIICTAVYNKYNFYLSTYINNYFGNLSYETYYFKNTRFGYQSAPLRSLFYVFELPLVILGLAILFKKSHPALKILFAWIILVPIGPSITSVGNPGRLNILMPVFQIIAAFGLFYLIKIIKYLPLRKFVIIFTVIIVASSFIRFAVDMIYYYPKVYSRYQRYGYKQLFDYLELQKSNYDQIILSRGNDDAKQYIHYLFFNKYDPWSFQKSVIKKRDEHGWGIIEEIGKIKFYPLAPDTGEILALPSRTLLIIEDNEFFYNTDPIFAIYDPNGDQLFEIYDADQIKKNLEKLKK